MRACGGRRGAVDAGWTVVGARAEPGPNDKNGDPGPFAALLEKGNDGEDNDGDDQVDERDEQVQGLYDYCSTTVPKGIGGNPDENGRYTDCFDDSDNDPDTPSCSDSGEA